jgi:N-acetylglucosaminyl-diphospho-decaprenol L-rhamnosyltransferase
VTAGTTVAVTLCSAARLDHLLPQRAALARLRPAVPHVVVWLDEAPAPAIPELADAQVLHVPPGPDGLRLAAGRNAGAERALALGAARSSWPATRPRLARTPRPCSAAR